MIKTNSEKLLNELLSPSRKITAKVELYSGSTLVATYSGNDDLQSILIERSGDQTKFVGFGVGQKATVKILDKDREKLIDSSYSFKIYFGTEEEDSYVSSLPTFYIADVSRDETNNVITLIGNDKLEKLKAHKITELRIYEGEYGNSTDSWYDAITEFLNLRGQGFSEADEIFGDDLAFLPGNHFGEEATLRDLCDAMAEIAYSIYFMDGEDCLRFTQRDYDEYNINKSQYFELDAKENKELATVIGVNDLGDNLVVSDAEKIGETQYFRNNPFIFSIDTSFDEEFGIDSMDNVILMLERVIERTPARNPIELKWRGNPLVEIGDILIIETKDGGEVRCPLINDTIEYNGGLTQTTSWEYEGGTDNEELEASNPSSLGEALTQTFAKVDKANKEIQLLTSSVENNQEQIAQLKLTTEGIAASVSNTQQSIDEITGDITSIQSSVEAKLSADQVNIVVNEAIKNVDSVSTSTGFKFDKNGLNITKTDSDISTLIDEDGMDISKGDEKVLTADNMGVNAINLTARQYLIIGGYSRFENFGENRTGCFWIGG